MLKLETVCLALCVSALPAMAAEWKFGGETGNAIATDRSGKSAATVAIGRESLPEWNWTGATGIAFEKDGKGRLITRKIVGGKAMFEMKFVFDMPLEKFRLISPELVGLDFDGGGCRFEYALNGSTQFKPLLAFDAKSAGYVKGGNLAPVAGPWIDVPADVTAKMLTLRVALDGYVGVMCWADAGGSLEYQARLDTAARVAVKLHPDRVEHGFSYPVDEAPRFSCNAAEVDSVRVFDVGRGTAAVPAVLTPAGTRLLAELPPLAPGAYDVVFESGGRELVRRRIALVAPARPLTFEAMKRSAFGIVGIGRRGGFRESAKLDGPAIGNLLGVHQERGGIATWISACNDGRGIYRFGDAGALAETMLEQGVIRRGNLAWTPQWAVDSARIQPGEWFGHYPPKSEHLADYAEYCRKAAAHYRGVIVPEFEIWNEPNNEPYGSFKGTFAEFVTLCRTAAEAVHAELPEARMILGTTGDADVGYIARLLRAGLSKHFSLVDIHPYRHTDQGPEDGLLGDITRLKRVIATEGDGQGIIFSEVGWPTTRIDRPSYKKVTEFEQACFNSRTLLISLAGGVERIYFHMLEDWGSDPDNPEHHFGFFQLDGSPKLAVPAMSTTARHLERAGFLGRAETPEYVHVWYWENPWRPGTVLVTVWQDMQRLREPRAVRLPGTLVEAADLWGGTPDGTRVASDASGVTVRPGADPLFLYLEMAERPALSPLPPDLRPNLIKRALARRSDVPLAESGNSGNPMIPAAESKAMAGAGIEGNRGSEQIVADPVSQSVFDVRYGEKGFTLEVEVKSGRPMKNDRRGWWLWAGDCIRLYIGNSPERFMDRNHYQICIAPTSADLKPAAVLISYDAAGGLTAGDPVPAEITAAERPDGWGMTVTIPWSFFGAVPAKGEVWHFDLTVPGAMWNNRRDDKWNNPGCWGEIEFL